MTNNFKPNLVKIHYKGEKIGTENKKLSLNGGLYEI